MYFFKKASYKETEERRIIMEKMLKKLFDYQKFEQNKELEKVLCEAETMEWKSLSDEELTMVSAGRQDTSPEANLYCIAEELSISDEEKPISGPAHFTGNRD